MKHVLLITGPPGIGKTTVLSKTLDIVKGKGFRVGGMLSREVREGGVRVGFEIFDLNSGRRGWLARVNQQTGPRIGKYRVNLVDLEAVGAKAIIDALENSDIVAIDEVGPMELFSQKFRDAVEVALKGSKTVIAVVHWSAKDKIIETMRRQEGAEIFTVTTENRDRLSAIIAEQA